MTAREPGPLPAHIYEWMHCGKIEAKLYTADQLRAYAAQEVAAERERCAKLCEDIIDDYQRREGRKYPELKADAEEGASKCAAAIRALR